MKKVWERHAAKPLKGKRAKDEDRTVARRFSDAPREMRAVQATRLSGPARFVQMVRSIGCMDATMTQACRVELHGRISW
jgi:hypothetical protein